MSSDQDGADDIPLEVVGFCPSPRDDLWLVEVQSYQLIVTDTDGLGGADSLAEWLATTTTTFRLGVDFLTWPLLGWIHTRTTHDGEVSDHLHLVGPSDLEDDQHDIQTVIWAHGRAFNTTLRKASPRVNLSQRDRRVVMHALSEPAAATTGAALRALAPRDAIRPFDEKCVEACGWHDVMSSPEFVHLPECLHRQWVGAGLDAEVLNEVVSAALYHSGLSLPD